MQNYNVVIKRRIFLFFLNIMLVIVLVIRFLNNSLMPVILEYGKYQCVNISTRLVNLMVEELVTPSVKENIVAYDETNDFVVTFDTSILNSISSNAVKKLQTYFYKLEKGQLDRNVLKKLGVDIQEDRLKKGIVYEIPISRVFNNALIANLGMDIPVRYQIIGKIESQVVSNIKEYGINNALLEVNLIMQLKSRITIPVLSSEETVVISIPLVMKLIQGDIPDSFYGSSLIGGNG